MSTPSTTSRSHFTNRPKAYIWIDDTTGLINIRTPYHKAFVEELKDHIPSSGRRWKAEKEAWETDPIFLVKLRRVAGLFFDITEHEKVSILDDVMDDPYSSMLKLASNTALKDIYFILVTDIGRREDEQALSTLGEAFRQISEEREI